MKISILAVLFTLCAISIIGAIYMRNKHEAKLNLHPVDTIKFDTLHSMIPKLDTAD